MEPVYQTHIAETIVAWPTLTPWPTVTPSATSTLAPPACTFPLANNAAAEPAPEKYAFSEPRIVLTTSEHVIYRIAYWLPDNQQVLIAMGPRNMEVGNSEVLQEPIALYSPNTGALKTFAVRTATNNAPLRWMPGLSAVVYSARNYSKIDRQQKIAEFTDQLRVSYGTPNGTQILADHLEQLPFAVKPDGSELVYFSARGISKLDRSLKPIADFPVDFTEWDYAKMGRPNVPVIYQMAWQPGSSLLFLYSYDYAYARHGGYTFIFNTDTGRICQLNLGSWAYEAHWSPDGRYLAVRRALESPGYPLWYTDLILLDSKSGALTTLVGAPPAQARQFFAGRFMWTPDGRHLLTNGVFSKAGDQVHNAGLYLIDVTTSKSNYVVPSDQNNISADDDWAWSPDGSKIVLRCPTMELDKICLINVQRKRQ